MKQLFVLTFIAVALLFTAGCTKSTAAPAEVPYVVIESHASEDRCGKTVDSCIYHPATYVIRHGNVVMHVHCYVLIRYSIYDSKNSIGGYDDPQNFPDPNVPFNVPLTMRETTTNSLDWFPADSDGQHRQDGVSFAIDSRETAR